MGQGNVDRADPQLRQFFFCLSGNAKRWFSICFPDHFNFMKEQGVQIDYAGLSYFPSSNIGGSLTLNQFRAVADNVSKAIARPIVIPETGYPSTADFQGQFANWRVEVPGYPLTPEGQEHWLADLLRMCRSDENIAGAFYWSPEWYGEGMWKAFALFDVDGNAKPAWKAFNSAK